MNALRAVFALVVVILGCLALSLPVAPLARASNTDPELAKLIEQYGYLDAAIDNAFKVGMMGEQALAKKLTVDRKIWEPRIKSVTSRAAIRAMILADIEENLGRGSDTDALEKWAATSDSHEIGQALFAARNAGVATTPRKPIPASAERTKLLARVVGSQYWTRGLAKPRPSVEVAVQAIEHALVSDKPEIDKIAQSVGMSAYWSEDDAFRSVDRQALTSALSSVSSQALEAFAEFLEASQNIGAFMALSALPDHAASLEAERVARIALDFRDPIAASAVTAGTSPDLALAQARTLMASVEVADANERALPLLEQANRLRPNHPETLLLLARNTVHLAFRGFNHGARMQKFTLPELFKAQAYLNQALAVEPSYADAYVYLGYVQLQIGAGPTAVKTLEKARTLGSTNEWLDIDRADAWFTTNKKEQAYTTYVSLVTNPATNELVRQSAFYALVDCFATAEKYADLKPIFTAYMSKHALSAFVADQLANVALMDGGEPEFARQLLESLPKDKLDRTAQMHLAESMIAIAGLRHFDKGRLDPQGKELIGKALKINSDLLFIGPRLADTKTLWPGVLALIDFGVKRELMESQYSLLSVAAKMGNIELASGLLQRHADINAIGPNGEPAILSAADANKVEMVRWLIDHGASPDIGTNRFIESCQSLRRDKRPESKQVMDLLSKWLGGVNCG